MIRRKNEDCRRKNNQLNKQREKQLLFSRLLVSVLSDPNQITRQETYAVESCAGT